MSEAAYNDAMWFFVVMALIGLFCAVGALISDWWLERKRADYGLPEPDTVEWRNARSLALYHGRKVKRDLVNRRFS